MTYALYIANQGRFELVAVSRELPLGWADNIPYGDGKTPRGFQELTEEQAKKLEGQLAREREVRELMRRDKVLSD